jgi:hypothetical protein
MAHSPLLSNVSIWIGIAFCITQSAIFSGLNLAIFSISKLRLEVEATGGNRDCRRRTPQPEAILASSEGQVTHKLGCRLLHIQDVRRFSLLTVPEMH